MYVSIHLHVQCHAIIPSVLGQYTTITGTNLTLMRCTQMQHIISYTASLLYTKECINTYTLANRGEIGRGSRKKERRGGGETHTDPAVTKCCFCCYSRSWIWIEHFTNQFLCFLCNCVPFWRWKLKAKHEVSQDKQL